MPANASAPSTWMQGFPPAPERTVRFQDLPTLRYPAHRSLYSHWREVVPTVRVWRGSGGSHPLPAAGRAIDGFAFTDPTGRRWTLEEMLQRTATDGLLILHDGKVLSERYLGELGPHVAHRCFSVTKSFVGLLAASLAHEGVLDPSSRVVSHLPELGDSGWADATVRQVMDMTLSLAFDEDYENPEGDVARSRRARGWSSPASARRRWPWTRRSSAC